MEWKQNHSFSLLKCIVTIVNFKWTSSSCQVFSTHHVMLSDCNHFDEKTSAFMFHRQLTLCMINFFFLLVYLDLFAYAHITKNHVFSVFLPPIKIYMSDKNVHVKNQLILYIHYSLVCNSYARHYVCDAHAAVSPSSAILEAHCS